eukprot:223286-Pyramimonas_sp.AAC.1
MYSPVEDGLNKGLMAAWSPTLEPRGRLYIGQNLLFGVVAVGPCYRLLLRLSVRVSRKQA